MCPQYLSSSRELNFTKPPIHGGALAWMMQHGVYTDRTHLLQIYVPLSRWTNWFFQYRDSNHDGLREYNHGHDSGWDNSVTMVEGLDAAGEHALAGKLREDFCRMAQQNGMYENFDATTGAGLRDPAYTWTSSV
jgi:hypothetical protein